MGGKKSDLTKEEKATSTKVAKKVEEKKSVEKTSKSTKSTKKTAVYDESKIKTLDPLEHCIVVKPVVWVYMESIYPLRLFHSKMPCASHSVIGTMKSLETRIVSCILITHHARFVCTTIVDEQYLKVCKSLRQETIDTTLQVYLCIVYSYDDGYGGNCRHML